MSTSEPTLIEGYNVTDSSNRAATDSAGTFAAIVRVAGIAGNAYERAEATTSSQVNQTQKSIRELLYNGTGYYIEDEVETAKWQLQKK
ncbi:hypothetical protein JTB14_035386 [Gonioctena quinquepunctata]|nr:hypothetical protein JTB14_035386 [Gonioctena quinquepunctata]